MELYQIEYTLRQNRESRELLKKQLQDIYRVLMRLPYGPERDAIQVVYDELMHVNVTLIYTASVLVVEKKRIESRKPFWKKLFKK